MFNIFKRKNNNCGKRKLPTSKLLVFFLFVNCSLIELFTMGVTLQSMYIAQIVGYNPDFTPLVTLIGAVVGEVIGFAVYAIKAKAENTSGGIEYETAMYQLRQPPLEENPVDEHLEVTEEPIIDSQVGHAG